MTQATNGDVKEDVLVLYEMIEKNRPKLYLDAVDRIVEHINKHREKADKKEASRQRGKEKRGLLVRKDSFEMEKERLEEETSKPEKVKSKGKVLESIGNLI